jgi:hypothetical protein
MADGGLEDTLVSQITPHFSLFAGNAILQEIINDS